jgi:hypothetical protein
MPMLCRMLWAFACERLQKSSICPGGWYVPGFAQPENAQHGDVAERGRVSAEAGSAGTGTRNGAGMVGCLRGDTEPLTDIVRFLRGECMPVAGGVKVEIARFLRGEIATAIDADALICEEGSARGGMEMEEDEDEEEEPSRVGEEVDALKRMGTGAMLVGEVGRMGRPEEEEVALSGESGLLRFMNEKG